MYLDVKKYLNLTCSISVYSIFWDIFLTAQNPVLTMSKKEMYLRAMRAPQFYFQVLNSLLSLLHPRAEHSHSVGRQFSSWILFLEVLKSYRHIIKIYSVLNILISPAFSLIFLPVWEEFPVWESQTPRFSHCLWPVRVETASALPHLQRQAWKTTSWTKEKLLTASAATSLLLMKSGMVADWKKEKHHTSRWRGGKSHRGETPPRHQARCEHHPSRAGGKVTDAASLDATGAGDCRDRGAATATGPGAPQTAPALLPQPGLPFPGSPAPAPGSSGGSGAPAAPAARAGSAAPAASSSCPQSPPPSWPGGVTAPPLPRPGAAAPALGGNANRGTFRSAAHQFRHPPPGVIALVKSKLWI